MWIYTNVSHIRVSLFGWKATFIKETNFKLMSVKRQKKGQTVFVAISLHSLMSTGFSIVRLLNMMVLPLFHEITAIRNEYKCNLSKFQNKIKIDIYNWFHHRNKQRKNGDLNKRIEFETFWWCELRRIWNDKDCFDASFLPLKNWKMNKDERQKIHKDENPQH